MNATRKCENRQTRKMSYYKALILLKIPNIPREIRWVVIPRILNRKQKSIENSIAKVQLAFPEMASHSAALKFSPLMSSISPGSRCHLVFWGGPFPHFNTGLNRSSSRQSHFPEQTRVTSGLKSLAQTGLLTQGGQFGSFRTKNYPNIAFLVKLYDSSTAKNTKFLSAKIFLPMVLFGTFTARIWHFFKIIICSPCCRHCCNSWQCRLDGPVLVGLR